MQPQTFQAKEMKEALALVRRELGPEAVIISTRRVPGKAMGLLGGAVVEVSAYRDESAESSPGEDPAESLTRALTRPPSKNLTPPRTPHTRARRPTR